MKTTLKTLLAFTLITLFSACGGSGDDGESGFNPSISDNPPNVSGTYYCTSGCNGPRCEFSSSIKVTQSGDDFIIKSAAFGNGVGNIDDDGNFSVDLDNGACDGQVVNGMAIADCTVDGVNCQMVTFEK